MGLNAWTHASVRELEGRSIRAFVESCSEQLAGRTLDYGCGKQPYSNVVEGAGGEYVPFDRQEFPSNVSGVDVGSEPEIGAGFDAVLCTQVAQYWQDPVGALLTIHTYVRRDGWLVMTYPTNWDEVEPADLWRYTRWGMARLLAQTGFRIERHERRAEVELGGFKFPLGYGVLAQG